jgi:hypothetical protein
VLFWIEEDETNRFTGHSRSAGRKHPSHRRT